MKSLRGRRLKGMENGIPDAREARKSFSRAVSNPIPFPFPYERYASMRAMSLFPAMFAKFKMPEGLKFFPPVSSTI